MSEFKVGDVVRLKSGGPQMTIHDFLEDGKVECAWFDEKKILQYQKFKPELLVRYEPPSMSTSKILI